MPAADLSPALRRTLETIATGYAAQMAPRRGLSFSVLAGILVERGLVREVRRRDGTRPYALTAAGRAARMAR